jgi:hypothetical protein
MAGKMKAIIKNIITLLIEPLTKGIKLIVPDAIIGSGISVSIVATLKQLDRKCFDVVVSAVKALPETISKFILDPNAAPEFLKQMIPVLTKMLKDFSIKIEDTSWLTTAVMSIATGPAGVAIGPIVKGLGPSGLNKMAAMLESNKDTLVDNAQTVSSVAIPMMFGLLAAWQVIMTGDFMFDSNKEASADGQETKKESIRRRAIMQNESASAKINSTALRMLIREELSVAESQKKLKRYRNS